MTIAARNSAGSRKRSDRNTRATSSGAHRIPCGCDLVPHAPHGDDRRGVPELAPDLPDVDVDGPGVAGERVAPDPFEQLVAGQDDAAMVEELPEQVELLRRQLDLLVADVDLAPAGIDVEVAVANLGGLRISALVR